MGEEHETVIKSSVLMLLGHILQFNTVKLGVRDDMKATTKDKQLQAEQGSLEMEMVKLT